MKHKLIFHLERTIPLRNIKELPSSCLGVKYGWIPFFSLYWRSKGLAQKSSQSLWPQSSRSDFKFSSFCKCSSQGASRSNEVGVVIYFLSEEIDSFCSTQRSSLITRINVIFHFQNHTSRWDKNMSGTSSESRTKQRAHRKVINK